MKELNAWYQRQLYGGGQRVLLERNGILFLSLKETKGIKAKSDKAFPLPLPCSIDGNPALLKRSHGDHN